MIDNTLYFYFLYNCISDQIWFYYYLKLPNGKKTDIKVYSEYFNNLL